MIDKSNSLSINHLDSSAAIPIRQTLITDFFEYFLQEEAKIRIMLSQAKLFPDITAVFIMLISHKGGYILTSKAH